MPSGTTLRFAFLAVGAALLALAGCVTTGRFGDDPDVASAGQPLAAFQRSLEQLRAGKIERVNVLQIGDSHTAGDAFSGHLRDLLQGKFGNAGRGMLPPGSPFPYWRPYQVEVLQRGGWTVFSSNRTDYRQLPYGLSGVIVRSQRGGDTLSLIAKPNALFDTVDLDYFRQPGGGHFSVIVDGRPVEDVDTSGSGYELTRKTISAGPGSRTLEVRTRGNGTVDVADWAIYRREHGVTLSSHGFIGAEIGLMGRWDSSNVARQLKDLSPTLIILAFGTNEGFGAPERLADYASVFGSQLAQLRQAAPRASIVVVGPPDADRLPDYCGARGGAREAVGCRPLSSAETADYSQLLRGRSRSLCRWHPPAGLQVVKTAQQEAARRQNAYFWDWAAVQGGACGADRWVSQGLGRSDRVHMSTAGYEKSADSLFDALLQGYRGQ
jgi:lysophospholipase L1-like esterase